MSKTKKQSRPKGGKELGLIELEKYARKLRYKVPEYFVVDDARGFTLEVIAKHFYGQDVIVRSNSIAENSEIGFDGIYESVIIEKSNLEKIRIAFQRVLDSLNSDRAIAYREKVGIKDDVMRVIVQKYMGNDKMDYIYFVVETSINPQGDTYVALSREHDFINKDTAYDYFIFNNKGESIHSNDALSYLRRYAGLVGSIGKGLHKFFGPVQIEGVLLDDGSSWHSLVPYLFQRRLLPKEVYQGIPEKVPDRYTENDILFRSKSYRGSGKFEGLPIILMPTVSDGRIEYWEEQLKQKASQLKTKEYFLFCPSLHLGVFSDRILNDYECLEGVRAIISYEGIDFASHAFKVASFAKLPFVSIHGNQFFSENIETLDKCSLYFTENEAVFCLDEKHSFKAVKPIKAESLKTKNRSDFLFSINDEEKAFKFQLNLKNLSFSEFEKSFCKLLDDISGETWVLSENIPGHIGFCCTNKERSSIKFSGWANYMEEKGNLLLENFRKDFRGVNKIDWSLIEKISQELS